MTTVEIRRAERIASESMRYARKAIQKSSELEAYLSLLEYKAGKVRKYSSVGDLFKKLKLS